jgi:hypothetical protein
MSILATSRAITALPPVPPTKEERTASKVVHILASSRRTAEQLVHQWDNSVRELWSPGGDITPAELLAAIGTEAGEMMNLSRALTAFLIATLTGKRDDLVARIEGRLATIPAFTTHKDGTVTITP